MSTRLSTYAQVNSLCHTRKQGGGQVPRLWFNLQAQRDTQERDITDVDYYRLNHELVRLMSKTLQPSIKNGAGTPGCVPNKLGGPRL